MVITRHLLNSIAIGVSLVAIASPASAQIRQFSIPAGSLKGAIDAFARQSGKQVIYRVDDIRGARSAGARGALTIETALDALLAGSGFTSRTDPSGAIAIVRAPGVGGPLDASPGPEPSAGNDAGAAPSAQETAIVVTGSRIRRPNLESVAPITSVTGEEFHHTGRTAIGEVLNDLPSLRSTVSQTKSTRLGTGGTGINLLDLRGLGTDRTLVLQNGRRHIAGAPFTTAADVNTIPTDLIERVDIVTGGSSAIYGSDAIAGVVNFVLKRDFEGYQIRAQGGISRHGDAGQQYLSAIAGTNFADGRGNVAANLEYSHQDDWYASDRPAYRNLAFYLPVDSDEPGLPNGSDGNPDSVLFEDVRYPFFSNGGTVLDFRGFDAAGSFPALLFQPNGTLVAQTGERVTGGPFGFFNGGNGSNLQEGKQFGYSPDLRRYSFNLLGHFTVSEAFEPFIEAKYVRVDATGSSLGSFFDIGNWGPRDFFTTDNPFLSPEAAALIREANEIPPDEDGGFFFGRNYADLGALTQDTRRETYRAVGGLRGRFNDDWIYEASASFAQVKSRSRNFGNVNLQRYLLAIDAVRDPQTGEIVCRSQIDPAAAVAYEGAADPAFAQARLAADVSACVPLNPFGEGNISPAAAAYVLENSLAKAKLKQTVLNAFMSGDTSQWFELPGGPVGFALGGEYRRDRFRDAQDELLQSGITHFTPAAPFEPPAFEVKELFGELRVPVLADRPFVEELTISAAGRLADYKGRTGTVVAWNLGGEWSPVRDLRFRVNQSRAVRAPNLIEVHSPLGQSFDNNGLIQDPCSTENIGAGSPNRGENCLADGVPAGFVNPSVTSFAFLSGGNPDLREEKSDSFTLGAVVQPRFLPGLSLSVDYYDIKVKDVIATPGIQEILNSCYDAATIDNQFCALFERNPGPGPGPNGEIAGQIIDNSLRLVPVNFAALKVRGIDVEAAYRRQIDAVGLLNTRFIYTLALQNDSFLNPEEPDRKNQNLLELGNPRHAFNLDASLQRGPVTFGYRLRYIGKMAPGDIENIRSVQGRPPQNADAFEIRYFDPAWYHDVRLAFDVADRFGFYAGVDNVTDRLPPPSVTGIADEGSIYNNIGRFFYAGAVARF